MTKEELDSVLDTESSKKTSVLLRRDFEFVTGQHGC